MIRFRHVCIYVVLFFGSISCVALDLVVASTDSLTLWRAFNTDSVRVYFTEQPPVMAQRLSLPSGCKIHQVVLQLGGPPTRDGGKVVFYGHERGLIVPRSNERLREVSFSKQRHGIEDVVIAIVPPLALDGGQTFVGVEGLVDSLHLLLVNEPTQQPCVDGAGSRSGLVFLDAKGNWKQSGLPLAVSLGVEFPEASDGSFELDTTMYGASERSREVAPYVTSGDFNRDGYPDIASAGVLYLSSSGQHVAVDMALQSGYPFLYFADVDGDGYDELVSMQLPCATELVVWHWTQGKMKHTSAVDLGNCVVPRSMTTIREGRDALIAMSCRSNETDGVYLVSFGITPGVRATIPAQDGLLMAVDIDADGVQELLVRTPLNDELYKISTGGKPDLFASVTYDATHIAPSSSGIQLDSAGALAVVLPRAIAWNANDSKTISDPHDANGVLLYNRLLRGDERPSSILTADLDNDGVKEVVQFAHGGCRKLFVFKQAAANDWQDVSWKFGLDDLYGCSDGLFVDLDNDGRIDFVTDRNGTVEVRYNRMSIPPASTIIVQGAPAGVDISDSRTGKRLAVVYRGRGQLMEDMPFLHMIGESAPDSLLVRGMIDGQYVARMVDVNQQSVADVVRGRDISPTGIAGSLHTVTVDGPYIILNGYLNANVDVIISTLTGNSVASMRLAALADRHTISLADIATSASLASGTYSITFRTDTDSRTVIVQLKR